jgi:hypothetical protein
MPEQLELRKQLRELALKYEDIIKKFCITKPRFSRELDTVIFSCRAKNRMTEFNISVDHRNATVKMYDDRDCNSIEFYPSPIGPYTFYELGSYYGCRDKLNFRVDEYLTLDDDFKLENFEKTLNKILDLPSFIRYKIRKIVEESF